MGAVSVEPQYLEKELTPVPDPSPSLFTMSLDLISVTGFDGYYKKVNPALTELLGFTWEELRSRPLLEFVHQDDREKTEAEFNRVKFHGVSITHFEHRMRTKSGGFKWISWKAQPDTASKLVFATGRDVTSEREGGDLGTSVMKLLQRMESIEQQNTKILMTRRPLAIGSESTGAAGDTDEEIQIAAGIKKGRVWWKVLAWIFGALVSIATVVFGAGVAYQKYVGDNATKADIGDLETERVEPLEHRVDALDEGMGKVSRGVESLVKTQDQEKEMKRVKRKLDRHDKQYQEAFQEYTADKAAGRRAGPRPQKDPAHIDLEEELVDLEGRL